MLLSKSCEYAIRSALYLAARKSDDFIPIRSVSDALGIPYHFLAKIAQVLINAGLLTSVRGPHGGITLARPAGQITLEDIVIAIDGTEIFTECVLGLPECGNRRPCPLHGAWANARERVQQMFEGATLEAIADRVVAGQYRLSEVPAVLAEDC